MEWDNYRVFLAVARAPSIRAAALRLGTSHSTVLRKIDQLEHTLGARLFERNGHRLALTSAGEEVRHGAEELEDSVQGIERSVTGRDSQLEGVVKLSTPDWFTHSTLLFDLHLFRQHFPNIQLEVELSYRSADLRRREADIAIRIMRQPPDELVGRDLGEFTMAAYATQAHIDRYNPASPGTQSGMLAWGSPERWRPRHGFDHLRAVGFFDNVPLQCDLARQGVGVASLPCLLGDSIPELVRISEPMRMGEIWVVYHADLRQTSRVRVVRDFLCENLSQHIRRVAVP
ncbi:transcriptional regulator [Arenicella chitinivorans]|uniref:Transcriptional regulator n=1 Tax=Arenicella chitinivorans TaxID=1329800 RepID=A0A918RDZ5_9GAMM|nr:LysR family transcriptional regulator [Arenicella chitinivorans]GGZ96208.1 transcriptional regulator [Arenicella chitinivorans]